MPDENDYLKDDGSGDLCIKKILRGIKTLINEMDDLKNEMVDLKKLAVGAGFSKKSLAEALRMMKQDDTERNIILSRANLILKADGRMEISTNMAYMEEGGV